MSTDSTNEPSAARQSVLRVLPRSQVSSFVGAEQRGQQGGHQRIAPGGREVGHLRRRLGQAAEVVPRQLVGTVGRMPQFGDGGAAARGVQVSQVTRRPVAGRRTGPSRAGPASAGLPVPISTSSKQTPYGIRAVAT